MAINTPANLARRAAPTTSTTLYTVPASTTTIMTSIVVCNTSSSAATFTLTINGVAFASSMPIAANQNVFLETKQVIAAGQIIAGFASSTSVIFHVSGMEIV